MERTPLSSHTHQGKGITMIELYKKYRPQMLKHVVGQNLASLKKLVQTKSLPQAVLFSGPSGVGKTTIARILRKKLRCAESDFFEVNAAKETGVDSVRTIEGRLNTGISLTGDESRIWLIDECHKLSQAAQNAFLKILEDTPPHIYFFLATTNPSKLLTTIKTRCHPVRLKPISDKILCSLVEDVCEKEGTKLPKKVLSSLVEGSGGSARQALVYLNAIYRLDNERDMLIALERDELEAQAIDIARALMNSNTRWTKVASILKRSKELDPEGIRRLIIAYTASVLLNDPHQAPMCRDIIYTFRENYFDCGFSGLCADCYEVYSKEE